MKPQPLSREVLLAKYAQPGETDVAAVQTRVARGLAARERDGRWEQRFRDALQGGFIPAGRIQAGAGTTHEITWINCFVQPVGDSIRGSEGGLPGIYPALEQAAETLRRGGGVGYDFSRLRPRGALVRGTGSRASGPTSFIRLFDRSCETLESAGARRGAQMGLLRADHPDILEFVHAKDREHELTNFNLSVAVSDAFMRAVVTDHLIDLWHPAEPFPDARGPQCHRREDGTWLYGRLPARRIFSDIVACAWRGGDPGLVFLETVNRGDNLADMERIEATNPCAEQPLPAYGACCLGSIDLTRLVRDPFGRGARLDLEALDALVPPAVRMLDNVLDLSPWPLPEQRAEGLAKRRIGLGFTGLADALVMLGQPYDSEDARATAAAVARRLRDRAYAASVELARERGPFPALEREAYLAAPFVRHLPAAVRDGIATHGIRNSHLLCIAPAGTISLAFADNVSSGIEPAFAWAYRRKRRRPAGGLGTHRVEDHAYRLYRERFGAGARLTPAFVSALQVAPEAHVRMVAAVAPFVDSGISKTVNLRAETGFADVGRVLVEAWRLDLKSISVFRPMGAHGSVLTLDAADAGAGGDAAGDPAGCAPRARRCPRCGEPGLSRSDGCVYCPACGLEGPCD